MIDIGIQGEEGKRKRRKKTRKTKNKIGPFDLKPKSRQECMFAHAANKGEIWE